MKFSDIASISGKGGLFKIVSPARTGFILESLDEQKKKMISGVHKNKNPYQDCVAPSEFA